MIVVIGLLVLPTAMGAIGGLLFGRYVWFLDLFNHFWFHYALVFLLTSLLLLVLRTRRLLALSVVMLALSVWQVWPYLQDQSIQQGSGTPGRASLEMLHLNVNTQGGNPVAVADYIAKQDADIVFLQEVNHRWLDALDGKLGPYEKVVVEPRTDNFGIACYVRTGQTRVKVLSSKVVDQTAGQAGVPAIELELEVDDGLGKRRVPVLSLHTLPPISFEYARARDAQLAAAGRWAKQAGDNAVVIGDLNATPWSKAYIDMLDAGGLHNSQIGFGRQTTWPAGLPSAMGVPIDHCVHGQGLRTQQRTVGEDCGSDHKALHIGLSFRGG